MENGVFAAMATGRYSSWHLITRKSIFGKLVGYSRAFCASLFMDSEELRILLDMLH